jgi:hypothetical protein
MDMGKLSFENVDITKIIGDLELETKFNFNDRKQRKKGKQTTISDFVNPTLLIDWTCQNKFVVKIQDLSKVRIIKPKKGTSYSDLLDGPRLALKS